MAFRLLLLLLTCPSHSKSKAVKLQRAALTTVRAEKTVLLPSRVLLEQGRAMGRQQRGRQAKAGVRAPPRPAPHKGCVLLWEGVPGK